eukprot:9280858-Alexandrium_andersonii.AAC.1
MQGGAPPVPLRCPVSSPIRARPGRKEIVLAVARVRVRRRAEVPGAGEEAVRAGEEPVRVREEAVR